MTSASVSTERHGVGGAERPAMSSDEGAPDAAGTRPRERGHGRDDPHDSVLVAFAEIAATLVTVAAVAGHGRLFLGSTWVRPLLGTALVAHVTMAALRRLGRGLPTTAVVAALVAVIEISWVHYRWSLSGLGLPTGTTRAAVDADITTAWNAFGDVKAPTEATTGFLVLATVAVWIIAYLADWAAFRLRSTLEAVLPSFAAVVFIAFFAESAGQRRYAASYLGAVVLFVLAHRTLVRFERATWLGGLRAAGTSASARAGLALLAVVVVSAAVIGPALPGADDRALVELDDKGSGTGSRTVVSPIVDIRGRLVDQSDQEVFTVRSETPAYWRLASLDRFDGATWGANNRYRSVSGPLPDDIATDAAVTTVVQQFSVTALGAVWIPAAYEARAISDSSEDSISYEPVSGTLIVGRDLSSADGLTYTVTSEIPTYDPIALAAAPDLYPDFVLERFLEMPGDFSPSATALARSITEGAPTDYDRAVALQDYFRDRFVYDLEVGAGHSSDRIDEFLASGRGYCEQFAGAFAAMARSIGMPARVVVGFTWGDQDPNDPTLWHVRGEHAHAWPEVYIPGSGWVGFEPTPGRGAPNAEAWTGVQPDQAGTRPGQDALPTPAPTAAVPAGSATPQSPRNTEPEPTPLAEQGSATTDGARNDGGVSRPLVVLAAIATAGLAYAGAVIAAKHLRARRAANRAAGDTRAEVALAWRDGVEELGALGLTPTLSETSTEFSRRVAGSVPGVRDDLDALAELTTSAAHGPSAPTEVRVAEARRHRDRIRSTVRSLTTTATRVRVILDPRPLLRRSR